MKRVVWVGVSVVVAGLTAAGVAGLAGRGGERTPPSDALVERGRQVVEGCTVCHAIRRQDPPRVGPPLWDIVDAPKARTEGFGYSTALVGAGGTWDTESLDAFLHDPQGYLPGTAMVFGGIADHADRTAAIAYLRSLAPR